MALGGLFKSRQQRQLERDMAIQNVVDLHKRRIRDLNKHERGYCEKAIRAKRQGDKVNYEKLARMLVQTINERRRVESALLTFEALVQTKDKIESYGQFAKGLQAATRSISAVFKNVDLSKTVTELNMAMARAKQMDRTMTMVLDRVSDSAIVGEYEGDEEAVDIQQIDSMLAERAQIEEGQVDGKIDEMLSQIENQLKKEKA
ncbi:MAG: hypothetical protein A2Y77_17695 [Planctomycetes bacterium RBG_13_62_9]|nr:MAG: hypothetical protein A2Y77_17695 [Planctomycetes bacterium RBG_13_62_9]